MPALHSLGEAGLLASLPLSLLVAVSLPVLLISYVVYQRNFHPLAKVPGPYWASITRLWMVKHSLDGDMHRTMIALHEKHGSLVRTGPNEVSVADPTTIKQIYGAGTKFEKSEWYAVWQGHRHFDLFAERKEKVHGQQRKLVSRPYAMESLKDLEPYVDETTRLFLRKMDERLGQVVDMGNWFQLFAFDIIGEITFSRNFGFLDAAKDDGSFHHIEATLGSAAWVGQVPWIFWLNDYLTPYIGNKLAVVGRHGALRTLAVKEVEARKDRGSERKDILSKLFAVQHEKPGQLSIGDVTSMATSNIFAGSDTTAISTRAIVYYLLKNPHCMKKLVQEIDDARRQGKLSDPVKLEEADAMPYLQAVMYEALRLHPAVGMSLPRVVPAEGATVNGVYLPAKTVIGANPWVIHRNKQVYGEDVEVFRPERWMVEEKGDLHRFFFAFGSGARTCIGRNISWMEMSKLIPTLLLHYDMKLATPDLEWTETCWWFVIQRGVNLVLTRRVAA